MIDPRENIATCGGTRAGVMGDTRQKAEQKAESRKQKCSAETHDRAAWRSHFCLLPSAFCLVSPITPARVPPHAPMSARGSIITFGGSNDQRDQTSRRPVVLRRPAPVRLQLIQT